MFAKVLVVSKVWGKMATVEGMAIREHVKILFTGDGKLTRVADIEVKYSTVRNDSFIAAPPPGKPRCLASFAAGSYRRSLGSKGFGVSANHRALIQWRTGF